MTLFYIILYCLIGLLVGCLYIIFDKYNNYDKWNDKSDKYQNFKESSVFEAFFLGFLWIAAIPAFIIIYILHYVICRTVPFLDKKTTQVVNILRKLKD